MTAAPRLVVVATSARALAAAARRAGFVPLALDVFGDQDTRALCAATSTPRRRGALRFSPARLLDAARALARRVQAGTLDPDDIGEELISNALYTAGLPDPDLLIRTAGELRVSNYLLWQIAYTEMWVTDVPWPAFARRQLLEAVADYQRRQRKFGTVLDS